MFGTQIDKLIAAKVRLETLDVLFLTHKRRFCELVRRNRLKPNLGVFLQGD